MTEFIVAVGDEIETAELKVEVQQHLLRDLVRYAVRRIFHCFSMAYQKVTGSEVFKLKML